MLHTFKPNQTAQIKDYFQENGYVVVKDVISPAQLTSFMESYENLKKSKNYYFRSQDTNRVEQLEVNKQGFIEHSILDPLELVFQKKFKNSALNIIGSKSVSDLLRVLTNRDKHTVWQTMFFDKSTGTVPHQDYYYLDTDPPGNLVAGWYALEDIQPDAGAFFVVPKSHKGPLIERNTNIKQFSDHEDYVTKIQRLIKEQDYKPEPMLLEKGSVLFWHPFLLHGAFENANPNHSRKSFTAHFLPFGYGQLGIPTVRPRVTSVNPEIQLWHKSWFDYAKASIRQLRYRVEYAIRPKSVRPYMEMRSSQYVSNE